ncbi:transposase [Agarilytica rhodophyticola]|uniref:transposase n=1 Tax=Agarilytica rhodophyticola TaxID=1737490 RepID=UPI000B345276|nr:transposase [Agarilytica rhodophyticola]
MPRPRKELVCIDDTPYYHITSRCVRRAFLCGFDRKSGRSYEHRRHWIEARIRILSSIFAIDICAYSVMSNHYHLVLKLNPDETLTWSDKEVLERWCSVFKGPLLVQKCLRDTSLTQAEQDVVGECITCYRKRLGCLGWFMKCLNEPIARQANKEDECRGHFWEARYTSQALLTEEALLSAMAYKDLNPVRAKMAKTPETSEYTSIKQRLVKEINLSQMIKEQISQGALMTFNLPVKALCQFEGNIVNQNQIGILFSLKEYLNLVDYTGRIIRHNKRGKISALLPPILERLNLSQKEWLRNVTYFENIYYSRFYRSPRSLKTAS